MIIRDTFERVYLINLDRRGDRWNAFKKQIPRDWPFRPIERVPAMDGKKLVTPKWWTTGKPAWGCYRTHLRLLEKCMNDDVQTVLLMEDDAKFQSGFVANAIKFLQAVPQDWGMLYFGGQHLSPKQHPPLKVNNLVYVPWNVNRTHAMALRGKTIQYVYQFLHEFENWKRGDHLDHWLGRFHEARNPAYPVYCPHKWLVGQAPGASDISGRQDDPNRVWQHAAAITGGPVEPKSQRFVAVIGVHSSGSSAIAGVLHHLGVDLGDTLVGYYGVDPDKSCGFEAKGLMDVCEKCIPFPATKYAMKRQAMWRTLKRWIDGRRVKGGRMHTLVGGKYPLLCRLGAQLMNICLDQLLIVHIDRPLADAVASLANREAKRHSLDVIRAHQEWLNEGKQWLLSKCKSQLTIQFSDLVSQPEVAVSQVVNYLTLHPTPDQITKAIRYVDPSRKHI